MTKMRIAEAAKYVGLSRSTMEKMRRLGTGPAHFRLGESVFYESADLDDWMNSCRRPAANTTTSTAA